MNKNNFLYNNEMLGSVGLAAILDKIDSLSFAKAVLVLPFLFDNYTLNILKKKNTLFRSMDELLIKYPKVLVNFSSRYNMLLPITINSILILKELEIIIIGRSIIEKNNTNTFINKFQEQSFGRRSNEIIKAAEKLSNMFKEQDSHLYQKLNIIL